MVVIGTYGDSGEEVQVVTAPEPHGFGVAVRRGSDAADGDTARIHAASAGEAVQLAAQQVRSHGARPRASHSALARGLEADACRVRELALDLCERHSCTLPDAIVAASDLDLQATERVVALRTVNGLTIYTFRCPRCELSLYSAAQTTRDQTCPRCRTDLLDPDGRADGAVEVWDDLE
jgi:hypothetical protein